MKRRKIMLKKPVRIDLEGCFVRAVGISFPISQTGKSLARQLNLDLATFKSANVGIKNGDSRQRVVKCDPSHVLEPDLGKIFNRLEQWMHKAPVHLLGWHIHLAGHV